MVVLVTCLRLPGSLRMNERATGLNPPTFLLFMSVFAWCALVLLQTFGYARLGGYSVYVWVGVLGLVLAPIVCSRQPRARQGS